MTSQDYDEIEKTFAGKWILDKDDGNVEAFFKAEGKNDWKGFSDKGILTKYLKG